MLKITIQNQTFKVKTKKVESNSNHNLSAQIFKGDEKSPIIGNILREDSNPKDVEHWAITNITAYLNQPIKIVGSTERKRSFYFAAFDNRLQPAIENFKAVTNTVKIIKGIVYIHFTSLGYFTEILSKEKVPFQIVTSLSI